MGIAVPVMNVEAVRAKNTATPERPTTVPQRPDGGWERTFPFSSGICARAGALCQG